MKCTIFILAISFTCCKTSGDNNDQRRLVGKWRVDKIISPDSIDREENRPEYNSVPYQGGTLFYLAKELNSVIDLEQNGRLRTTLVFTTFGKLTWTTNTHFDSLTLKLTNVQEQGIINEGLVDKNGEMYFYEGQLKFIDEDNIDWILSDGRTFKLKREKAGVNIS